MIYSVVSDHLYLTRRKLFIFRHHPRRHERRGVIPPHALRKRKP